MTDEQLNQRLAALGAQLELKGAAKPVDGRDDLLTDYIALHQETRARHQDRLDAIAYEPPGWIVDVIGERPTEPDRRTAWDRIVDSVVRYRASYNVPDDFAHLLGPKPPSVDVEQHAVWISAHRVVERGLHTLSAETAHGIEVPGR